MVIITNMNREEMNSLCLQNPRWLDRENDHHISPCDADLVQEPGKIYNCGMSWLSHLIGIRDTAKGQEWSKLSFD